MLVQLVTHFIRTPLKKTNEVQDPFIKFITHHFEWDRISFAKKIFSQQTTKKIPRSIGFGLMGGVIAGLRTSETAYAHGEILTTPIAAKALASEGGVLISPRYTELTGNVTIYPETGKVNFVYEVKLGDSPETAHASIVFKLLDKDGNLLEAFSVPRAFNGKGEQVFSADKEILKKTTNVITSIYHYRHRVWVQNDHAF